MILLTALVCFAALNVSAQTEEPETKGQKYFRLTKTADENPTDWKAQWEAGAFLLDKENGMDNPSQAAKYYDRVFHLATDYNKEIPDSVIREAGSLLMAAASNQKDLDKTLFYIDEMAHASKVGVDIPNNYMISFACAGMMCSMMKEEPVKSLSYVLDLRERVVNSNTPGIEYTDGLTAFLFEQIMEKYMNLFGDKVMELTLDDQKYYFISIGEWNIEKPFMGWSQQVEESPRLLYGEDGKVYDDIHTKAEFSFMYHEDQIKPQGGANTRLVAVTPEHRQQMVEAYRNYMKKTKKNKK